MNDDLDGKVTCWWFVLFLYFDFVPRIMFCAVIKGWLGVMDYLCLLLREGMVGWRVLSIVMVLM